MNKERIIIYILCFLLLLMGLFLFLGLKDAKQCLGNPFIYGANKMINKDTGSIYSSCSFESFDYAPFYFDNKEIKVLGS